MKQNQMRNTLKIKGETLNQTRNPLNACSFTKYFSDGYYPLDIFLRQAVWVDSVTPCTGTITSLEQFKPIRIRGNLLVNCKRVFSVLTKSTTQCPGQAQTLLPFDLESSPLTIRPLHLPWENKWWDGGEVALRWTSTPSSRDGGGGGG